MPGYFCPSYQDDRDLVFGAWTRCPRQIQDIRRLQSLNITGLGSRRWFDAGPPSATAARHQTNAGSTGATSWANSRNPLTR